jgi:site-specific DNA-methyltransferase (cytosine-N4-specific)
LTVYYTDDQVTLHHGDALEVARELPNAAADCIVTSPPYFGLRDYGTSGQYGLESSPAEYVETMRGLFTELRRVLADDGTVWINLGDSYSGSWGNQGRKDERGTQRPINGDMFQPVHDGRYPSDGSRTGAIKPGAPPAKNLLGIPWRVAFALQDDGWILRNAIIWHKPNAMPESVTDRLSGRYEHVFLFSKSRRYWFDLDPIREPIPPENSRLNSCRTKRDEIQRLGTTSKLRNQRDYTDSVGRNPGDVWTIPTQPFSAAHFAVYPIQLPQRCILAGCKPGGTVLDPFSGSGTTGLAAQRTGRKYIGIDLNADYLELSLKTRLTNSTLNFEEPA